MHFPSSLSANMCIAHEVDRLNAITFHLIRHCIYPHEIILLLRTKFSTFLKDINETFNLSKSIQRPLNKGMQLDNQGRKQEALFK